MELKIKRPISVWISQILLVASALLCLGLPFLRVRYETETLAYYGITGAVANDVLHGIFINTFIFIGPILIAIAFASWGMIKGNRMGRLITLVVFTFVSAGFVGDLAWPDGFLNLSLYMRSLSGWGDNLIKLFLIAIYCVLIYRLAYGRPAKIYFSRHLLGKFADPPPPPSFDNN
jgi:hypothetical protein